MVRRGAVFIAAIALASCGGAGEVSLRADRESYLVEETAVVTLENVDARDLSYAPTCPLVLEGAASDNVWTVIRRSPPPEAPPGTDPCRYGISVELFVPAGEQTRFHWPLDVDLVQGMYRFTLTAQVTRDWRSAPEEVVLHSQPFRIYAPP